MSTWKVVCATLVIFITGIVTGVLLVHHAERNSKHWVRVQPGGPNNPPLANNPVNPNLIPQNNPRGPNATGPLPSLLNREFMQVLERQLRLTPEQHERIDRIMLEGQQRVREVRTRIEPELRKEMQEAREKILDVLEPKQREQFEKLMKQRLPRRNDLPQQPERRTREHNPLPPREVPDEGGTQPQPRGPAPANP